MQAKAMMTLRYFSQTDLFCVMDFVDEPIIAFRINSNIVRAPVVF
jgi:hypothetical protein